MKTEIRRIFVGFVILMAFFAVSQVISFRNLGETRQISSRYAEVFQPSIIRLNELEVFISDSKSYLESWVVHDMSDREEKRALRELHKKGVDELTGDLLQLSNSWNNKEDELLLRQVILQMDTILREQKSVMDKLNSFEAYSKDNWLVRVEVEGVHLVKVRELSAKTKREINVLNSHMKAYSISEKDLAQESYGSIQNAQVILTAVVLIICLIVAWVVLRYLRSEAQKKLVEDERDEIKVQKAIVEEKNNEILSSISYAERLQKSMLPAKEDIALSFSKHFIFYRPRDIVSGDFYWFRKIVVKGRELILIAAADATGHGVPGAFVSFVCHSSLNRAVDEFNLTSPCKILDKVSELVSETFSSDEDKTDVYDGMDISLCVFDFENNKLCFAGANNPAYILRDGEMHKIAATRRSVGRTLIERSAFEEVEWDLRKGDFVYLFSDGFQDQFGGERGKKYRLKPLLHLFVEINKNNSDREALLQAEFDRWKGEEEQVDDVLILGLEV